MRLRSLRSKIALVFVLMILIVQAAVEIATVHAFSSAARNQVNEQLAVGDRVFHNALQSEADRLAQAASIAAADFGFREAVALHDDTTVHSALQNQRERLGADISMLVGLDGRVVASSPSVAAVGQPFPYPSIIGGQRHGVTSLIGILDGRPYELVSVPVKTPLTVAWMVMGFAINDMFARDMHGVAGLDISFMVHGADARWTVFASSLAPADRAALAAAAADVTPGRAELGIDGYGSRIIWLANGQAPVAAVLQKSLADASAPFRELRSTLLLLTLCGIAISIVGATLTARSVTRPLGELTRFAERVGRGDYRASIEIHSNDETSGLAAAFRTMRDDIAEREARITELAYMDQLTGLPNRVSFNEWLQREIDRAARNSQPFAVLLMDLDRFKDVNETLGHHVGDSLLHGVGKRLADSLAGSLADSLANAPGTVARLGGDEFAILLPGSGLDAAQRCAGTLLKALEAPMLIEGQPVDVGASVGIACFPVDGTDMHTLLRRADVAMYSAKQANTGMAIYDHGSERRDLERLSLMSELRRAIENNELLLYYQPKIHLADNSMAHLEALVRWRHPERGLVPPGDFIPFAEQTGFIRSISRWIAREAVEQCARWRAQGLDVNVSINFSARDLTDRTAPDWIAALLKEHGVEPRQLWIEITESALMDDQAHALTTLERLRALGIRMSIDDFGTGYSSLSYLKRMPVTELKIDRSFVIGMASDADDEFIVRSTIALGHNMGLLVAAEGVEDEATLEKLRALGCDTAQGYYIGRPVAADEITAWLARWTEKLASIA
ncbi:bifunctional diguanylate cyclase/phosphodiesterase [Paraburkholderia sp. ZP32-5]|uniref:bifunctional diguanylate cyclase/phosphodiesterase n=1 Tax=Paraburkholderia sp. ZP32-5 TaxID=2883245 RepID=UPI001F23F0B5|nr:EAL domain-containing protein [Paraburkholderia sp. ZP32-5]